MLVGRASEATALEHLLDAARAGCGGAVVLRGDPGIGKTALLATLDDARGITMLATRGFEADAALPFAALITLLGPVTGHRDLLPEGPRAALEAALALGPPAASDRFAAYHGMLMLLEAAADALGPLVLRVDDAHWLDPASMEALAYCARRIEDLPVAIVAATRIGERVEATVPGAQVLTLPPLGDRDARDVLAVAPVPLASEVADRLVRVAGGNPLALVEIPGALTDAERTGRDPLPDPLPVNAAVDGALRRRVERLDEGARRALVVVAAGIDDGAAEIRAACRTLGCPGGALEEAASGGVLTVRDGGIGFAHPLMRSVVLDAASAPAVREAHRALAGLAAPDRAGWHLAAAALGQDDAAAAALDVAAGSAAARTAYATASDAFARAARLSSIPDARAGRLLHAAGTGQMAGRFPQVMAYIEEAAAIVTDPALGAEIDHMRGMVQTYAGSTPIGAALFLSSARVAARASGPGRAARMLVDAAMTLGMAGEPARGIDACRLAREMGGLDEVGEAKLTLADGVARFYIGTGRDTLERGAEVAAACAALTPGGPDDHAIVCGAILRMYMGDLAGARETAERGARVCRDAGAVGPLAFHLATVADICWRLGDWAGGAGAAAEAVDLALETGQSPIAAFALHLGARFAAATGRESDCRGALEAAAPMVAMSGSDALRAWAGHVAGFMHLSAGRATEAVEALEEAAGSWQRSRMRSADSVPWEHDMVEACIHAGRTREARSRLQVLATEARGAGDANGAALVERLRGLLLPGANAHFPAALALHARAPRPFEVARTRLVYGERLTGERRGPDAREQLRLAIEGFDALGAVPWADRARAALAGAGAKAVATPVVGVGGLTPKELRVALAVAVSVSDAEAAARLMMPRRTVSRLRAEVFAKLGVSTREELAALVTPRRE